MLHALLVAVGIYAAYGALMFGMQRRVLFPGQFMGTPGGGAGRSKRCETVWLRTSFGKVEAWYVPAIDTGAGGKHPAVIHAHGNGEFIDLWLPYLEHYNNLGLGLLLVEFPGYGRSEGRPSQKSVGETFDKAYDWLQARPEVDADRILAHGRSVGGGAVCLLATRKKLRALILESTFTSTAQFAHGYLLPGILVRDRFDNLSVVKHFDGPVLVRHGVGDDIIPFRNGKRLAEAARNARFVTWECAHNDCPPDWIAYWKVTESFLVKSGIIGESHNENDGG